MGWVNILQFMIKQDANIISEICGVKETDTFMEAGKKIADTLIKLTTKDNHGGGTQTGLPGFNQEN